MTSNIEAAVADLNNVEGCEAVELSIRRIEGSWSAAIVCRITERPVDVEVDGLPADVANKRLQLRACGNSLDAALASLDARAGLYPFTTAEAA